jgi:hypothetical protein
MKDKLIDIVWHWQVGWLRRPEMDGPEGSCYEEPEGDLVYTTDPRHRKNLRLCIWEEADGFRYTSLSKAPMPKARFAR